jgi:perosamine synthetase
VAVDINRESWNIDSSKIAAAVTSKTKAIILVDNYGRQNDISEIRRAIPENIAIIQDSAESFPGNLETEKSSCPDLITISCYANKILTAGEGGAVIGKPVYIDRIKGLKNQSQNPSTKFSHTEVGYNYRITNMQAAVFNTQWRKKNQLLKERAEIFKQYFSELSQSSINWTSNFTTNSTPWLFTISVQRNGLNIADVIDFLRSAGIESRPGFTTVSKTRFLADRARIHGSMEISENLSETVISLPTFPGLKQKQIKRIVQSLEEAISEDV